MEIKITTTQILTILHIVAWILFAGLCVQAGAVICIALLNVFLDPADVQHLWQAIDLTALYEYDQVYFLIEMSLICIVTVMKAWIFYLIIKILHEKKLDMAQPFNRETGRFILKISYLALFICLVSSWGINYAEWFVSQGVKMPDTEHLQLGGNDVWLFMAVILFVVAQIFKRGIEMQEENELTV